MGGLEVGHQVAQAVSPSLLGDLIHPIALAMAASPRRLRAPLRQAPRGHCPRPRRLPRERRQVPSFPSVGRDIDDDDDKS